MIAGLNRKRKNAATGEDLSDLPRPEGKVGRPSKGGDLMRSKRYYFKNHLKILQKRKLKRYVTTVHKIINKYQYDSDKIKKELETICTIYKYRDNKNIDYNTILHAIDLGREDRYLSFLEEESDLILAALPKKAEQSEVEEVLADLASKHATRLFQISTLWSAYLLSRFLNKQCADMKDEEKTERLLFLANDRYTVDYAHLTGQELPSGFIKADRFNDIDPNEEYMKKQHISACDLNITST